MSLDYLTPATLDEASRLAQELGGEGKILAGGTAVVLMMGQGLLAPRALVSLERLEELSGIHQAPDGWLEIGALTRLSEVARSAIVRGGWPALAFACQVVANERVRNQATAGGNLCEADYASDPPTVLWVLGAEVATNRRRLPIAEFLRGFYETALQPGEILTAIRVPPPPGPATYVKYVTRSSEDRPCLGVAALLERQDGRIAAGRVAVGAVAGWPQRLAEVEALLAGEAPSPGLFEAVGRRYAERMEAMSDARGSAGYRRRVAAVFVQRALEAAWQGRPGWKE